MAREYWDSKTAITALALAAVIHGTDKGVRLCCEKLYKKCHRSIHPHVRIIHMAASPRRVTLRTLVEYINEEQKHEQTNGITGYDGRGLLRESAAERQSHNGSTIRSGETLGPAATARESQEGVEQC